VPEEPRFVPLEFGRLDGSKSLTRSHTFLAEMQRRRSLRTCSTERACTAGLATLTHTPSPMGFLREILERPEKRAAVPAHPVCYPVEGCLVPDLERKPLDEIIVRR
jgi:hypothetical protein